VPQRSEHLTEDQAVDYAQHKLHPVICGDVRAHLRDCSDCNRRMNHLLDQTAQWEGDAGRKRLARVCEGFLREAHLAAGLERREAATRAGALLADIQRRAQGGATETAAEETAAAEEHRRD
jgi:hypothetical protein